MGVLSLTRRECPKRVDSRGHALSLNEWRLIQNIQLMKYAAHCTRSLTTAMTSESVYGTRDIAQS